MCIETIFLAQEINDNNRRRGMCWSVITKGKKEDLYFHKTGKNTRATFFRGSSKRFYRISHNMAFLPGSLCV